MCLINTSMVTYIRIYNTINTQLIGWVPSSSARYIHYTSKFTNSAQSTRRRSRERTHPVASLRSRLRCNTTRVSIQRCIRRQKTTESEAKATKPMAPVTAGCNSTSTIAIVADACGGVSELPANPARGSNQTYGGLCVLYIPPW